MRILSWRTVGANGESYALSKSDAGRVSSKAASVYARFWPFSAGRIFGVTGQSDANGGQRQCKWAVKCDAITPQIVTACGP